MARLTHLDGQGKASMVDVGGKAESARSARASGFIRMDEACYRAIRDNALAKGDALAVARVAGIMAAKKAGALIPLCHPIFLSKAQVDFVWHDEACAIEVVCLACASGQTGVEMEALTGASVALLTLYDMAKAMDKSMVMTDIRLLEKRGGKGGDYVRGDDRGREHD